MPLAILQLQLIRSGASDEHPFTQSVLTVGRADDNAVILEDPQVSGHHLLIELANSQFTVTDLGSRNGAKLNGQPLWPKTPAPLRYGDVIELVEFRLALRPCSPQDLPAAAERMRIAVTPRPGLAVYVGGKLIKAALAKPVMTLGRSPDNDILIEHPMVSRRHAQITQQNGVFIIADAGSANGLTFNGQRAPQRQLADGDVLTIGGNREVAIQFRASIGFLPAEGPRERVEAQAQPQRQFQPAQAARYSI